jgi:hypothetical protein
MRPACRADPASDRSLAHLGRKPVVGLDARAATHFDGDDGAFGALNLLPDGFQPGEGVAGG